MPEEITNAVLATKLDSLRELMELRFQQNEEAHKRVDNHLEILNGQVEKNTEFRVKGSVYLGIIIFVASTAMAALISKITS